MAFDLGKAMRKKEEFESARLMDFEFRQRARATRHLARVFGLDEGDLVSEIATHDEEALLRIVADRAEREMAEVAAEYSKCLALARKELIAERGDPKPYRLG
jgi:hypothetical protein